MIDLTELYDEAAEQGVEVFWFSLDRAESLSFCDEDGKCYIAMDPWYMRTATEELLKLGHELGHCATGSFYNEYAALDIRQKHENRANKWAIKKIIPEDDLLEAVAQGYREPWELAEYFNVPEPYIRKAMELYHGQR